MSKLLFMLLWILPFGLAIMLIVIVVHARFISYRDRVYLDLKLKHIRSLIEMHALSEQGLATTRNNEMSAQMKDNVETLTASIKEGSNE